MAASAQLEAFPDFYAAFLEFLNFTGKGKRINYDPVSDYAGRLVPEYAGWNQVEHEFLLADFNGMSGIVPPLETYNYFRVFRKDVNYFAFTLIPPLNAD
jgi:hypothetical protein